MKTSIRRAWLVLLTSSWLATAPAAEIPSPESELGFRPGADFHLAPWAKVVGYFGKVDAASDRVVVRELGRTTEDRPYLAAFISSEANIRKLEDHRKVQRSIAQPTDPARSPAADAEVATSKPVVLITCSIHSNETASTLMATELLHELATKDDPATREILENTILILVPSANPDGVDIVASWYERTKGKPWEGEGLPKLYHYYAGHDTNRDWFMLNLKETQALTRLLYKEWFPTIAYDVHQMGSRGARLFVPPFFDPINPNVDPRINQGIFQIGAHMAADLASAGKAGVLTNAMYDNWQSGGNRTTVHRHNIVAVLTEAASVKLASPIYLDRAQLAGATRGFANHELAANFVDPWAGGWWRLRDIVDYELIAARSLLTLAARYRGQFQANYLAIGREAIRQGREDPPFAWVVPAAQRDPGTASKLIGILQDSGIQVRKARAPFAADGVPYPAGSWILPADQPYRAHLKDLMERQVYPNRLKGDGSPEPPYDIAGWTLPLQMGVAWAAVNSPLVAESDAIERVEAPIGRLEGSESPAYYSIANQAIDDFRVLNALIAAGIEVQGLRVPARANNESLPAGTLVFEATSQARSVLDRAVPGTSSRVVGRGTLGQTGLPAKADLAPPYRAPRVAVYQPWVPSMDEGWARFVLDSFAFPYTTVHDAEVRAGSMKARFDTLLIPAISARTLREGNARDATEPAYVGGLGRDGIEAIRAFVKEGGTLVCLEGATQLAIEEFALPVTNVLKGLPSREFYSPGSIFRVEQMGDGTPRDELMFGMPPDFSVWFDNSEAFQLKQAGPGILARYAERNPLDSGWLLGAEKIQGKAALVKLPVEKGRVILFGFSPHHRGQPVGTLRLLFNCLYPL